jgi:hypothetical protein
MIPYETWPGRKVTRRSRRRARGRLFGRARPFQIDILAHGPGFNIMEALSEIVREIQANPWGRPLT